MTQRLSRTVLGVETQRQVNAASRRRELALDPGDVALVDGALGELPLQSGVGGGAEAREQDT